MTDLDLRAGKLEQACPDCGRWEAAGSYCSGCGRPMGAADWYPNGDLERRAVARQKAAEIASTRVKRPRSECRMTHPHFRVHPIKPLRRLAERRSPELAGGRFGASPASRHEAAALRSGPDTFSARVEPAPALSFPPVGTGLGVAGSTGSRERITGTPPGE